MKKILTILLSAALVGACDQLPIDPDVNPDDGSDVITFSADVNSPTRVAGDSFESGDQIAVSAFDVNNMPVALAVKYTYDGSLFTSETPIAHTEVVAEELSEDGVEGEEEEVKEVKELSFQATYPALDLADFELSFEVELNQESDSDFAKSDLLVAKVAKTKEACPKLSFYHVMTNMRVKIKDSSLSGGELKIFANSKAAIDIANGEYVANGSISEITPKQDAEGFQAVVAPQRVDAGAVVATYELGGETYTWEASEVIDFKSGYLYEYEWDIETNKITVTYEGDINDWDSDFIVDIPKEVLVDKVDNLKKNMVSAGYALGGESHFDFSYPAMMMQFDAMAGELAVTSSDDAGGFNWFSYWGVNEFMGEMLAPAYFTWENYKQYIDEVNYSLFLCLRRYDVDDVDIQRTIAHLKVYRALFYLDMARLYEPFANDYTDVAALEGLTVPLVTEQTTTEEQANNPRMPRDEMFDFIFAELDEAEQIYSDCNYNSDDANMPSVAVINGLRARAYMWLGRFDADNYEKAAEYAHDVIDMVGDPTTAADWTSPTLGFNTPTSSWVWCLPQSASSVNNLMNYVSFLSTETTWGYGRFISYGLRNVDYDRMGVADIRKSIVVGAQPSYEAYKDVTCCTDEYAFNSVMYPYTNLKFRPAGGETEDSHIGGATSVPLMRVDEMYLIEAEANAQLGKTIKAADILEEFMAGRDSNYSAAGISSQDDLIEEIIFQKRMEFWGEGVILFDLKRLGAGIHSGYEATNVCSSYRFDFDGVAPWWNLCIANEEVEDNAALEGFNNPDPSRTVAKWN